MSNYPRTPWGDTPSIVFSYDDRHPREFENVFYMVSGWRVPLRWRIVHRIRYYARKVRTWFASS